MSDRLQKRFGECAGAAVNFNLATAKIDCGPGMAVAIARGIAQACVAFLIVECGREATAEYLYRLADETAAPTPQQEKQDGKTKGL